MESTGADRVRIEVKGALIDHFVESRADIARHGDGVAAVQREVLRGLRDRA